MANRLTLIVFLTILSVRLLCANLSIIPDCDEVYNYYEPTHYLTHGFGLQTWEYSGQYAIRSWAYIWLHASIIKIAQFIGITPKYMLFYSLRYTFAVVSAFAETSLFLSIAHNISQRVAAWYLIITGLSTGMFHASVSFLPSSFAMDLVTFSTAQFLYYRSADRSRQIIMGVGLAGIGGILGWPFSLLIVTPFLVHHILSSIYSRRIVELIRDGIVSLDCLALILGLVVAIDSVCYRKLVIVPYNIVSYNVLNASEEAGPEIFGVEPWYYYVQNLLLNFNVAFILALMAIFTPFLRNIYVSPRHFSPSFSELLTTVTPFFLWFGILTIQPHKEERFMYVGYPSLCINAALSVEAVIVTISKISRSLGLERLPSRFASSVIFVGIYLMLSLSRSIALREYYGGTMLLYQHIPQDSPGNICIGREWYRYASSYFLHDDQRLKFIRSGFDGLLPGEFIEEQGNWWNRTGTWEIPKGMNNKNIEDASKYVYLNECDYVIDSSAEANGEIGELQFTSNPDWQKMVCSRFLNSDQSKGIGRILWLPEPIFSNSGSSHSWDLYCIMKRKDDEEVEVEMN